MKSSRFLLPLAAAFALVIGAAFAAETKTEPAAPACCAQCTKDAKKCADCAKDSKACEQCAKDGKACEKCPMKAEKK